MQRRTQAKKERVHFAPFRMKPISGSRSGGIRPHMPQVFSRPDAMTGVAPARQFSPWIGSHRNPIKPLNLFVALLLLNPNLRVRGSENELPGANLRRVKTAGKAERKSMITQHTVREALSKVEDPGPPRHGFDPFAEGSIPHPGSGLPGTDCSSIRLAPQIGGMVHRMRSREPTAIRPITAVPRPHSLDDPNRFLL